MESVISEAQSILHELLFLLEEGFKLLPHNNVPKELRQAGYTLYKGVITPEKIVAHKYLFDYFESPFLIGYIALFKALLNEHESVSNEFAFRTLLEMGCENSFILFNKAVDPSDKKIFILATLLADYSSIETSERKIFNKWLINLFNEHKTFLNTNLSKQDYEDVDKLVKLLQLSAIPLDQFTKQIKIVRQLINKLKSSIMNKYEQTGIFKLTDTYKRMKSGEAHMLHGNAFLILDRMGQQSHANHVFRVLAYLTISGVDLLNMLPGFLKNDQYSKKVSEFMTRQAEFRKRFQSEWAKIRRGK